MKAVETGKQSIVGIRGGRRGIASGFAWSNDGLFVTSHHHFDADDSAMVILANGAEVEARLVGRDPTTDVAVLRADTPTTPPPRANLDALALGQFVVGLGYAGAQLRACFGVIGALDDAWTAWSSGKIDRFISADFQPQPGYSGGTLFTLDGSFVGMNTTALVRGLGVTLPHTTLDRVVSALAKHGRVERAYLGVGTQPVPLPAAMAQLAGQRAGLIVHSIEPGGPSEGAGVLLGDVLLGVAGTPVPDIRALLDVLAGSEAGRAVELRIVRAGKLETLTATLGNRP